MRLTKEIKDKIKDDIIFETFKEKKEKIKKLNSELADEVYDYFIIKEYKEYMEYLPDNFFSKSDELYVTFNNESYEYGYRRTTFLKLSEEKKFPYFLSKTSKVICPILNEKFNCIQKEEIKIKKDKEALESKINGLLKSVNTKKQLLEIWPDVEKYLPEEKTKYELQVKPDEINNLISEIKNENK